MAKQLGLHQLRGKVGEHSYYKQTGISSGLVRSINLGMSQRVKTGEEYANVRLNNAEFGQGGRIAAVLARYINPKFRPMVLPFSQSKMAKIVLEYIKNDTTAPWGQRNIVPSNSGDMQVDALNAVVKNRFNDFGIQLEIDEENSVFSATTTTETISKLSAILADGVLVRFLTITTWIGKFAQNNNSYAPSIPRSNVYTNEFENPDEGDGITLTYELPSAPPQNYPCFGATSTGLCILLPFRTINGTRHILQEHCTFKAFVIADGPVA